MDDNELGPKPPAHLISFDRSCFAQDGTQTEYSVLRAWGRSGPAVFTDKTAAEEYATRTCRTVLEQTIPVMRRIKWTV